MANNTKLAVIYRFKNDSKIYKYNPKTKKDAEMMVLQLMSNPNMEYVNISDEVTL